MQDEHGHDWSGYKGTQCLMCQVMRNTVEAEQRCGSFYPFDLKPPREALRPTPNVDYSSVPGYERRSGRDRRMR